MVARALAGLLAVVLVWTALGPSSAAENEDKPKLMPSLGIPYASISGSGAPFVGTVEINAFESTGDGLAAETLLRYNNRKMSLEFPIEVLRADCRMLELRLGPPDFKGLLYPLVIMQTPDTSVLHQTEFCRSAEAVAAGDFDELAFILNQDALLDAGAYPWHQHLSCRDTIEICALPCEIGVCAECLDVVGTFSCETCLR